MASWVRIGVQPRILTDGTLPVESDRRRIILLHADQEITHAEQRPRAHGPRAPALVQNLLVPVDEAEDDAVEGLGALGLDDVDAAASGHGVLVVDDFFPIGREVGPRCFQRGGEIRGGGAGDGVVGEGDVAGHGHDLRRGGRGGREGEEQVGE